MNRDRMIEILEKDGEERYDFFLSLVLDEREIWILVNGDNKFLKIVSEEDGVAYLPVWPSSDLASHYAESAQGLVPKSISLPDFFRKWVPGLTSDGLQVGVLPGEDGELWITEPDELKRDLQDDLF